jgi:hypothetical protein
MVPFTNRGVSTKGNMILDDCIATDFHARPDNAEVADVNSGANLRAGIDDCACGDLSAHLSGDLLVLINKLKSNWKYDSSDVLLGWFVDTADFG